VLVLVALSVGCGNKKSNKSRTEQQLDELQKKKDADAQKKEKDEKAKLAPAAAEVVNLSSPYTDASSTLINPDGPCPEGMWALFPGDPPGATKEEKKANAAKKKDLADSFKGKQFLIKLRGPGQVTLKPYDAPKGSFPVEVLGTIDCTDPAGRIAIAWTAAKAGDPGNSAVHEGSDITQNIWMAPPLPFELKMTSQQEAKDFFGKNVIGLSARVVFTLGKVEVDKKIKRVKKVTEKAAGESLGFGGGDEDWGAGRMVHAELVGVRVATDREKKELFDQKTFEAPKPAGKK
jgi:hypothetical protein